MTRLRIWCAGASLGYVVGWLAGSNVLKMAEGRRLARPEPRTALSASSESPEPLNGRETGAQRIPTQRDDELAEWEREIAKPAAARRLYSLEEVAAEFGIDLDACDVRSPGGGLVCICRGRHRSHTFQGTSAPDRKDDTDEGIE